MSGARLAPGSGQANVATGVPLLDHLLAELATAGRFDLALEIEPEEAVFLDDLGVNLKPDRALGMHTIKVEDPGVALDELGAVLGMDLR